MPPIPSRFLRDFLSGHADSRRFLRSAAAHVRPGDLLRKTGMGGRAPDLYGRSVLIAAQDQLAAGLAMIELDGIARRMIVCPPDLAEQYFPRVMAIGEVEAIVSDYQLTGSGGELPQISCSPILSESQGGPSKDRPPYQTEWVLLTSGTTGAPKMIAHSLASLTAPLAVSAHDSDTIWGTFYDIRRYGGLQIFLRAVLGGCSLVLSSTGESIADHLARLAAHGVTHISGTPSQWRRVLMSPASRLISPRYIRLSGEIVEQTILDGLRSSYPHSAISHAFATTEAGVAFEVKDGVAGFPESFLGCRGDVETQIRNGSLLIRSSGAASRYLDSESGLLADEEGFVDTGDIVDLRAGRYHFLGRRNGVINVGGLKVYPEEVEAVINRHPAVRMSVVRGRKNPVLGALVAADVVVTSPGFDLRSEILEMCRASLPVHKVPATIRCVAALEIASAGKLVRHHA